MKLPEESLVLDGSRVKFLTRKAQREVLLNDQVQALQERQERAKRDQSGVILDYLRFTFKRHSIADSKRVPTDSDAQDLARWFAHQFANLLGFKLGQDRPGRDYYEFTSTVENEWGHEVASVSAGGDTQRDSICFTMKGEACTFAQKGWEYRVHAYFQDFQPTITRIDLAKDFFQGEASVEEMRHLYECHEFSYRNRRPSHELHGGWLELEGQRGMGRTFQVGKRDSGKMFRGYEKGHQLGLEESRWFRGEVELRNVDRVIPWECLVEPGDYYAGAYEATRMLCNRETAVKLPTSKAVGEASGERLVRWVKHAVAPALVLLTKATPNLDWLEGLVLDQAHRPLPKRVRALPAHILRDGIEAALRPYSDYASAPAAVMH